MAHKLQGAIIPLQTGITARMRQWLTQRLIKKRNVGTYTDGPAKNHRLPIEGEGYEFAFNINVISNWEQPVPAVLTSRHVPKRFHAQHKLQKGYLTECYLLQDSWFEDPTCVSELSDHVRMEPWDDSEEMYFNEIVDPRILEA